MPLREFSDSKFSCVVAVLCAFCFAFSGAKAMGSPQPAGESASGMSTVAPRIVERVDESRITKLKGNVPLLARSEFDQGEVAPSVQLTHIRLVLSRSAAQEAALAKFQSELSDKSSPNYHKWLTPEEFGRLYGSADSDVAAIVAWLESHGLKLENVSKGKTSIAFSGTVSQVEEAFHTKIHSFDANGQKFYSNTSDPSIPAALAPVVMGVAHLNTIQPKANHIPGPTATFDPATKRPVPLGAAQGPRANLTINEGTTTDPSYFLFIVPGDAATIYDTPNTFNANYSGTSYTGTGVTIGIGGDAVIMPTTVVNYRSLFLGNSTAPTITNVDGVTSTDDTDEAYIDTELSGGLAPGAAIHFYTSTDLTSAIVQAIDDNTVDIFSLSFGLCELELTTSGNAQIATTWQQAMTQGIAVTVSTGDTGSASCDAIDPSTATAAQYGLSVSGFASTPYNIAVGGTDLAGLNSNFSTYASTSQGSSATFYRTALSYIPESTWNDSTQSDTTISLNTPFTGSNANFVAGSGGVSDCSTNTNTSTSGADEGSCTSGYSKPSWQRGTGFLPDNARDLPEVSLMAGNGYDPATWLVCTDDAVSGSATLTQNCALQSGGTFYAAGFGGTSTAAPAFAGILAMVEQKVGTRLGTDAAQVLYSLYNSTNASTIFHDTTVGNNSVSCVSGTPNCVTDTAGFPFESGYNTAVGYDLATGMGSVDAKQLVNFWASSVAPVAPTMTETPSATTILFSNSLTVTGTVSGSGATGTPTGTVTLSGGGYTSASQSLSGGTYSFTIPGGSLAGGTDTLTVEYSGDSNYGSLSDTASVIVTAPVVSISPTTVTFANTQLGSTDSTTGTVTVSNTGTAPLDISSITLGGTNASSFADSTTCSTTTPLAVSGNCTITVTFAPITSGSLTATITVTDDAASSPQTVTLNGTSIAPGFTLSNSGSISVTAGATTGNTSTISVTPVGGFTGAVALSCTVSSPAGATSPATCSVPASITTSGALTVSTTSSTTPGSYTVTVSGTSTSPAITATTSVAVTVTAAVPPSFGLSNSGNISLSPGATSGNTSTITVTPTGGFTGAVALTCSVSGPSGATDPATCTLSPASVTISGASAQTSTLTITTTAPTTAENKPVKSFWPSAGGAALAMVFFFGIPARRRNWISMLGLLVFFVSAAAIGCGGGGSGGGGGGGNSGTTPGSYSVTVTGTAGSTAPTTTVTVTVN